MEIEKFSNPIRIPNFSRSGNATNNTIVFYSEYAGNKMVFKDFNAPVNKRRI